MNILNKTGSILFCFLPVLLALGIQIIVTFASVIVRMLALIVGGSALFTDSSLANVEQAMASLSNDSQFLTLVSIIYAVLAAIALGLWYRLRFVPKHMPRRSLGELVNLPMIVGLVLLMVGMQYLSTYMVAMLAAVNHSWFDTYQGMMESIGFDDITPLLALYTVFVAPISEELIFRGVTLKYAARAMPFFLANIFQALLFGAFHGNIVQGAYAFVAGLFCGYVCYKGGSLWLSILLHMMFNLWGAFAPDFLSYAGSSTILHLFILVLSILFSAGGAFLYQKGASMRKSSATVR